MQSAVLTAAAIPLPPNPVWRSYSGGSILRRFRGFGDSADDHFPEDWLASTVRARNDAYSRHPDEGLSRLGEPFPGQTLAELLGREPGFWFGTAKPARRDPGVLWKLLDASVRLQIQAHPDADFARRHLGSVAGKTECWYILATRGEACVYLGFQRAPGREAWAGMVRDQRVEDMLACFDPIPVQPGECYVVPAGIPHAIGAGIFMVELMEPTDWVMRCERVNAGITLPAAACYMGLDLEACLDVFDYTARSTDEVRHAFQQSPLRLRQTASCVEEELIGNAWHRFFRLHRWRGAGNTRWPGGELMLLIALAGAGELVTAGEARSVKAGQTWLLPGAAESWEWQAAGSDWELLLAKCPRVTDNPAAAAPR